MPGRVEIDAPSVSTWLELRFRRAEGEQSLLRVVQIRDGEVEMQLLVGARPVRRAMVGHPLEAQPDRAGAEHDHIIVGVGHVSAAHLAIEVAQRHRICTVDADADETSDARIRCVHAHRW